MSLVLKGAGKLYLLPVVVICILVPLMDARYFLLFEGADGSLPVVCGVMQRLMPLCAIWWVFLVQREYLEGEGKEILFMYSPRLQRLRWQILLSWLWFLLHLGVVLAVHSIWFDTMLWVFLQLVAESLVFVGLYILFTALLSNSGISLLLTAVYYFGISGFSDDTFLVHLNIFYFDSPASADLILHRYLWVALAGVILLFGGLEMLKRKRTILGRESN